MGRIALLNYTGNEKNWGCKTTSSELEKLLINNGQNHIYRVPIDFSSSFKERLSGHIKLLFLYFNLSFLLDYFRLLFIFYFEKVSWNKKIYLELKNSDMIVLNGEGTIHAFNRAVSKWMFYIVVAKKIYRKKTIIANHTYQIDQDGVFRITKLAYSISDKILVREPISKEVLVDKGILEKKIVVVGDAAFMKTTNSNNKKTDTTEKYFAICGNVKITNNSINILKELIKDIIKQYNFKPVFLIADPKDEAIYEQLKGEIRMLEKVDNEVSLDYVMEVINGAEFFITGRFHPFIFAIAMEKLCFTYKSNTYKIEGVKKMTDYKIPNIDLSIDDNEVLLKTIDEYYKMYLNDKSTTAINISQIRQDIILEYKELF